MALYDGTVEDRYNRGWLQLEDDRKIRGFDKQHSARRARRYVDPDTLTTVTATGDNDNGHTVTVNPT